MPSLRVWFSVQFGLEREFTFCSRSLQKGAVFSNRLHVGCKRFSKALFTWSRDNPRGRDNPSRRVIPPPCKQGLNLLRNSCRGSSLLVSTTAFLSAYFGCSEADYRLLQFGLKLGIENYYFRSEEGSGFEGLGSTKCEKHLHPPGIALFFTRFGPTLPYFLHSVPLRK